MKYKLLIIITLIFNLTAKSQNLNAEKTDKSQIITFKEAEDPPFAIKCKSKWNTDKKNECTKKFIMSHINRKFNTGLAAKSGMTGRVEIMIEYLIDTEGEIINVTAKGGNEVVNQHAIEVIELLPNFNPGRKDGKPINVSFQIPIIFNIQD